MKRNLSILSFLSAVLIIVSIGIFTAVNLSSYVATNKMVNHTLIVKEKLKSTLTMLLNAETGQRGYLITGNKLFLQHYNATTDTATGINKNLKDLRKLTADNPNQQQRLDLLDVLCTAKLDRLQKTISLKNNSALDLANTDAIFVQGKQIMEHIRQVLASFENEENTLLQGRLNEANNRLQNLETVTVSGLVMSILCLLFSFSLTKREEKKRQAAEKDLIQTNSELDLRVKELASSKELIKQQLNRLDSLHAIDLAILSSTDLLLALNTVLAEVTSCLHVDIAAVFVFNPDSLMLKIAALTGNIIPGTKHISMRLGDGISGKAALERRTIATPVLADIELPAALRDSASKEGIQSIYVTPLIAKGVLVGVLTTGFRTPFDADPDWIDFFEALVAQTSMAVESIQSFTDVQRSNLNLKLTYDTTIEGWSKALDLRDDDTEGHTLRVTEMTMKVAELAGMNDAQLAHVRRGSLLHDIGKMGVPDTILLKPGKLTDEEWAAMRKHPGYAHDLLSPIIYLRHALDIPYCHHERWDGSGYPNGLKGDQIPLAARLFAVVDVWDALRSDRPYRKGWPEEKVIEHIKAGSGSHFDPDAVELFLKALQKDEKDAE